MVRMGLNCREGSCRILAPFLGPSGTGRVGVGPLTRALLPRAVQLRGSQLYP